METTREAEPPAVPAAAATALPPSSEGAETQADVTAAEALPPVESLTLESDFAGFLRPGVDESLKRAALKQLFRDPRLNVMDGLDTYIDDYTRSDPIPPEMLAQLMHGRYIFDPPKTMVNAEGHVIDVPPNEAAQVAPELAQAEAQASLDAVALDGVATSSVCVDDGDRPSAAATRGDES